MFRSVLIANRGEIAVRVITACQELGIRTIAVYSDADREAAHVRAADEAYRIGPAPAAASYLNIEAILAAARLAGAEAIHPGYGFLSENAEFAEACVRAGIVFIGPPPEAIRLMGSKTAAKRAVEADGVPTVPGYAGDARDSRTLRREAERIGYPLMLKASAGGGGKGMRAVLSPDAFDEALEAARREALAAFGDDSVFLEKLLVAPRHIEFQVLADQYGTIVHLGERECSIQRRHQKVVEESPSPALTPALRAEMGAAAVRAARAAGYVNAGTCEFLLDADGSYYFLEMNTRLQVEHPVTENVTGLDLVHAQLRIAAGEPLEFEQQRIVPRGHSIEVRLYAEDPATGYLPSIGKVYTFAPPRAPGVRVDAGIASGDEVTLHYDPMLAKLIVAAEDRTAAVERLRWALDHFAVLGVATNLPLLRAIAADEAFVAGETTTAFLDTRDMSAATRPAAVSARALLAAAIFERLSSAGHEPNAGPFNPWTRGGVRLGGAQTVRYTASEREYTVSLAPGAEPESFTAVVDGKPFAEGETPEIVAHVRDGGQVVLGIGPVVRTAYVARRGGEVLVFEGGVTHVLRKPQPLDVDAAAHGVAGGSGVEQLVAPMAGTVLKVNVSEGDRVEAQQTVVVLGAMKMEHAITAPHVARVRRVPHAAGDVVPGGEVLVELDEAGADAGVDETAAEQGRPQKGRRTQ